MLDKSTMIIIATWDTAQMTDVEMDAHCDSLAHIMRRMANPDNWDLPVSQLLGR